jgi:hypothetical protein
MCRAAPLNNLAFVESDLALINVDQGPRLVAQDAVAGF